MSLHSVYSRCQALGYQFGHTRMKEAGKQIVKLYRDATGQAPARSEMEILGKTFTVNLYPEEFAPQMDSVLHLVRKLKFGKAPVGQRPGAAAAPASPSPGEARPAAAAWAAVFPGSVSPGTTSPERPSPGASAGTLPRAGAPGVTSPGELPAGVAPEQANEEQQKRVRKRISRPAPVTGTNLSGRKSASR